MGATGSLQDQDACLDGKHGNDISIESKQKPCGQIRGQVLVPEEAWRTYQDNFVVQMHGLPGCGFWQGIRSRGDFEDLRHGLEEEKDWTASAAFAQPLEYVNLQPWKWTCYMRDTRSCLQTWLDEVLTSDLCGSDSFREFLFRQPPATSGDAAQTVLALPIMGHILSFLEQPSDVASLSSLTSKSLNYSGTTLCNRQWERMYAERWRAFHEAQVYHSELSRQPVDWKSMYQHTDAGRHEALLEVYDREKKLGFAMSCMLAKVIWDSRTNSYIASYVSASQVLPERISYLETYRLRFCPPSVRRQLRPELRPPQAPDVYGYRVLAGVPDVKAGQGVELQWKMQQGSPFGWWFGIVESLERDKAGRARLTMTFEHFPSSSRWRRLQIVIGDGSTRQCAIGGWHGGVRAVTHCEQKEWAKFFPKEPVFF
ncbi:unnamed protein product [Effrenium voratum]|uniref:Uncharacterized protein n=1 Tax=Effrenium voratum TaxID=2562239 RepID=A0AA36N482_9DINO|nr:unnamed protein product [Effrenium voratum]CAJ1438145.1 unnamed protein product [Effrenium voratum]|eukprot:CAMPEP_0181411610 /NCGR_PEP_ID=MMETSP1110-20121109/7970_1 /TAXON_ID=174948 /ORGANISM="Symbiodinium sp., Strain CCMP421" /LENGTH=425 /DNA_ID=CAMNT_0023534247 /DNA_START=50 /DNA_END=1327 /DNA_ORIENTATION=-